MVAAVIARQRESEFMHPRSEELVAVDGAVPGDSYEPPRVRALGNVSDLLAQVKSGGLDADCASLGDQVVCEP